MMRNDLLVGINAFYDTTRLERTWYSSGSLGLEMAALISGQDAWDLNFNWYGNLFSRTEVINSFRRGPDNFDLEAGYSHELHDGGPDLRLSVNAYRFSVGTPVYGWNAGAELKSRNGMFSVKYETGEDRINSRYHTLGGSVNLGLQVERLLSWENPFVMPEPIFQSPRNLNSLLTRKAERRFAQSAAAILARRGRSYVGGDRVYSTLTRQAPISSVSGKYGYDAVGLSFRWLTDPVSEYTTDPSTVTRFMDLSANIARSEVDPAGVGYVEVTMFNFTGSGANDDRCYTRVTFYDTTNASIIRTPQVTSPSITRGTHATYTVNLSAANMVALAQAGADVGAIAVQVQTASGGATSWLVRPEFPALIVLNE